MHFNISWCQKNVICHADLGQSSFNLINKAPKLHFPSIQFAPSLVSISWCLSNFYFPLLRPFWNSIPGSTTRALQSLFNEWILLVTSLNPTSGALVVWPGMPFQNSRGYWSCCENLPCNKDFKPSHSDMFKLTVSQMAHKSGIRLKFGVNQELGIASWPSLIQPEKV